MMNRSRLLASSISWSLFGRRRLLASASPCINHALKCHYSIGNQNQNQNDPSNESKTSDSKSNFTHFGFQKVLEEEKETLVGQVFSNVSNKYDIMNDLMSGGLHRYWKDYFIQTLRPDAKTKLLDVAGGTGDIAFRFLDSVNKAPMFGGKPSAHVTVLDINPKMLEVGKQRAQAMKLDPDQITWVEGNAEALPIESNSMDAYTIAFGIRNCTHIDKVVKEAYRVLVPGGRFLCLELSHIPNEPLQKIYDAYSFSVIPMLGELVTQDRKSYQYLIESIRQFPKQEAFAKIIQDAGFKAVTFENLTFGVVAIHSGFKLMNNVSEIRKN